MSTSMCWAGPGGVQTVAPPSDAASPVHLAAQPVSIVTTESPIIAPFNSFWNSNPFSEQAREGEGEGGSVLPEQHNSFSQRIKWCVLTNGTTWLSCTQ